MRLAATGPDGLEEVMRPNIVVIAIDEAEYWTLPEGWADAIEFLGSLYAFDRNSITHVAEVTGSYELHQLGLCDLYASSVNDDDRDTMNNYLLDNYDSTEPITYIHANVVDRMVEKLSRREPAFVREFGDMFPDFPYETDEDRRQYWHEVEHEFARNSPL